MPSRYVDPLRRDEGQDFCLDMTDMAALKVDVIKQGRVNQVMQAANNVHNRKANQVSKL